ncbi:PE-PGRS family protein [Streptomyces sp. NPDC048638]|uniref:PE-PGRS family protein n=1 Tax=Streptomyces sp. NPDC048638 TaxID=3365580 RepID=UPI003712571A
MTGGRETFVDLLRRAGLENVGDGRTEGVSQPWAAWRPIISFEAQPTVAVRSDRPDLVDEVNAQWHRLAVEGGVINDDGEFLIDIDIDIAGSRPGCGPGRWTRVRLNDEWDLAGVLGERPGRPEFVTLSVDGNSLLGATTEEYEVWLIAVDRIAQRQEAAAQKAAEETPQERSAAWEALFRGPGPAKRLREGWAHGLALNPATPEDVQIGLLGLSHSLLWRQLPTSVVEAAMAHPEWEVRQLLAEAQSNLTDDQWARLVLGEHNAGRRWILTMLAAERRATLTDAAYEQLAADPSAQVRVETTRLHGLPTPLSTALAADPEATVRAAACPGAWPHLEDQARTGLLGDPDSAVRAAALLRHYQDHPLPRSVFDSQNFSVRATETCRLERDLAEHLARHADPAQRRSLARNPGLVPDLVTLLGRDPDESVRFEVSQRPDLTEEQRAGILIDFDPRTCCHPLDWVLALHDDPDAMRRLAASSHPLVRRSVARARHLPPEVVALLARDEDRVVRLFLAESCDDAPADMLLEVWQWWTGSFSCPDRPHGHPRFPRRGLLRYAEDPNPRMRQLALDDPDSTVELVERFSRDPEEEVRRRAATDPRLTAASAVRLLDDAEERVRRAAARHPHLPARVLVRLLRDTDTARDAAGHPALPVPVIRRMVLRWSLREAEEEGLRPRSPEAGSW